jgi:hypothetical protein
LPLISWGNVALPPQIGGNATLLDRGADSRM